MSMLPKDALKGKTAIVTGGGTGIGKAIAKEFARLGASVVVASRKLENLEQTVREIEAEGGVGYALTVDVRDPVQVQRMADATVERFGSIDILVNNASGIFAVPAERMSYNAWKAVTSIIMDGTFLCTQAAAKQMIKQGKGGSILNLLTPMVWTGNPGTMHNIAAKSGVYSMTQSLAVEWAKYRIRVNALAPGFVPTKNSQDQVFATEEAQRSLLAAIPWGRFGTAEEMALLASYMVSDYADYVTGAMFVIDGGAWLNKGVFPYE